MSNNIEHLEQGHHSRTLILSGPEVLSCINSLSQTSQTYDILNKAGESLIVNNLDIRDHQFTIHSARRLGLPPQNGHPDKRPLQLMLDTYSIKKLIMHKAITGKPKGLFINEYVTSSKRPIMKELLQLRKTRRDLKIQVYVRDGTIFTRNSCDQYPISIRNVQEMENFLTRMTTKPLNNNSGA